MSELNKPPRQKINWLKRLNLEIDDDDSSDATPQRMEPQTSVTKKAAVKKVHRHDESKDVTLQHTKEKHQEDSERFKKQLRQDDEERQPPKQQRKSDERKAASKIASIERVSEDGGHRATLKQQEGKMRKRSHAEMATKEKTELSVHSNAELAVDPAQAKAAAFRHHRMQKLQDRRKATGKHDRLTAVKLKRLESSEASRLKRNQREQLRKTETLGTVAPKSDAKETEPRPRPPPLSREEAKERRNMRDRQRRAALKAKTEVAAKANSLVLSKHSISADLDRQKRHQELRRALGVEPHVSSVKQVEPRQKRRKMHRERNDGSTRALGESASKVVVSKMSPVKTLSRNKSEIRATGTSKTEEMTESRQNVTQNGESEKSKLHKSLSPRSVTNGGVKLELSSIQSDVGQTEGGGICGGEVLPERKHSLSRDQDLEPDIEEEGEINSPALVSGVSDKVTEPPNGKIIDEKNDVLLDMMPIPRKSFKRGQVAENAASFVIPKRSALGQVEDHPASRAANSSEAPIAVVTKPLSSPKSSPQLSSREPIRSQRMRKKDPVPVKISVISTEDKALMRLGRKRNSIFMATKDLASHPSGCEASMKMSPIPMMGYEVLDIDGKVLPDLIPRLSCATKREMSSGKGSFAASFFGVSLSAPKAKEGNCLAVDECTSGEEGEVREMGCYEELQFERPEDRDFYQQRMYGTTFAPLQLRGRTTLTARNVRFERKSTGVRFNQDRDREEFAAALSKRYTFNKSVPRCNIPRDNWQKLTRNQPATVYLHYYNREDAERASHVFHDDCGNPLELKREYKAGVVISRGSSPAAEGRPNRAPHRSCSSERSAPEPSPLSSHGGSARSTPHLRREYQSAANGDYRNSRYDRPPPAQSHGGWDEYGPSSMRSSVQLGRRSRSRSRPRPFPAQQHDLGAIGTDVGAVSEAGNGDSKTTSSSVLANNNDGACAEKPTAPTITPLQSHSTIKNDCTRRHGIGSDEEQEEGEIESSAVDLPNPAIQGDDRRELRWSSPRCRQQPHDMQTRQRQEDFRGDSRHYMREPVEDYRAYEDRNRDSYRRPRSRSRPVASEYCNGSGRDGNWDPYPKERCRSREFGPTDPYNDSDREWRINSDNMDCYGGRDYRDGGDYNGHRGDAYSQQY